MLVELHVLQNFAPSCLNRDESNSPKSCVFGGYRRARISSQCIKSSIRKQFFSKNLKPDELGIRTKKIFDEIQKRLVKKGKTKEEAEKVTKILLEKLGISLTKDKTDSKVLIFLGNKALDELADLCFEKFDTIEKDKKAHSKAEKILNGNRAIDIAMFGRMIAEKPESNIDAATQVAHALSTNTVEMEFDFFTAMDDSEYRVVQGSGMMGSIQFNSACYYRYSNVDVNQLINNLGGDKDLAIRGIEAFIKGTLSAIPTGKQTSMAAQNPPSFCLIVIRDNFLCSLANAFTDPVKPNKLNLVQGSIERLVKYHEWITKTYGNENIKHLALISEDGPNLASLEDKKVDSVQALVDNTMNNLKKLLK
ncbi:MAG: type I-E CRISPR-associated protein Cas7/Cse4/CasC [Candidatus Helarchaeota archaeon]